MKRALISVSDEHKKIATDFTCRLVKLENERWEIISTGGTARVLRAASVSVREVSEITGFTECLDGRLKTLHPAVHGGLLNRRTPKDRAEMAALGIDDIDLVVVTLYPFADTIAKPGVTIEEAIEQIDIGGPAMLRSAAKNFKGVIVVVDPNDYEFVLSELQLQGEVLLSMRRYLAGKVFDYTARYDATIADYFRKINR